MKYINNFFIYRSADCLAVGLANNTIQLWDVAKGVPFRTMTGHSDRISSLSWYNQFILYWQKII